MGVKDLWSILEPSLERQKLDDLNGLTVAVDLGFWFCQMSSAVQNPNVVKPYLRNLFFRICALLRRNIKPIFVSEGEPPEIKQQTILSRQNARFGHNKCQLDKPERRIKRTKFGACLKECCELIQLLGLPVVESDGEAEAYCAALNSAGIVDGVITDDGDALLYGALCVYRNFNLEGKVPTFDCYKIETIEKKLNLNRRKLIALALLLGCDYCPKGVPGVGKENAMKFIETLEEDVLDRLKNLSLETDHLHLTKHEAFVKSRVLKVTDFPKHEVINEYLRPRNIKDGMTKEKICWKQLYLTQLQPFLSGKVDWPNDYIIAKVVPLIILWNLRHKTSSESQEIIAQKIVKQRIKDKVPVYEVQWAKFVSDIWTDKGFYVTLEEKTLIDVVYPQLVEKFAESKKIKVHPRKNKKLAVNEEDVQSAFLFGEDNDELENKSFAVFDDEEADKENIEVKLLIDQLQQAINIVEDDDDSKDNSSNAEQDEWLNANSPLPLAKRLQLLNLTRQNSLLLKDKASQGF